MSKLTTTQKVNDDATKDIQKLIDKLEEMGKQNNYTVYAKDEKIEELRNILDNLFDISIK